MYSTKIDISQYLSTKIEVFVFDPLMRKHTGLTLKHMGFTNVTDHTVPRNYFDALNRIVPIIAGDADLVMMNLPSKPYPNKNELITIYEMIGDHYSDIKMMLAKRHDDPLKLTSKVLPLVEVGDYLREKLIDVLVKYRVPAAFFMTAPMAIKKSETASRKQWKASKNLELFFQEMSTYLNYYFRDKDDLVTLIDDKLSEKELSERKNKYDELMVEAKHFREKGDFDTAINLLRQAIEVFPQDIEAFLESGRVYVRKREYSRALIRYGQAEDLFDEAPEPNKEIGNLRITQVKEKIKEGASPDSDEIKEMLEEAVSNFKEALGKAAERAEKHPESSESSRDGVTSIASEILKQNLGNVLGADHPVVKELMGVVQESTQGLDGIPLDELTGAQCLAMGMHALESEDMSSAEMYFFQALTYGDAFSDACSQINQMGIALRRAGMMDVALEIYEKLLEHKPPNKGSVFWNMAIAFATKDDLMEASGYAARCLLADPELPLDESFYKSLTPPLAYVLARMLSTLGVIVENAKKQKAPPQLIRLNRARDQLIQLITDNKRGEALKLFVMLVKKAQKFAIMPEFHGDGRIIQFLQEIRAPLSQNPNHKGNLALINKYLKYVAQHPAPPRLAKFQNFAQHSVSAMGNAGDPDTAAYYFGKALLVMPESYFKNLEFYARECLPLMGRRLAVCCKNLDRKRLNKRIGATKAKAAS